MVFVLINFTRFFFKKTGLIHTISTWEYLLLCFSSPECYCLILTSLLMIKNAILLLFKFIFIWSLIWYIFMCVCLLHFPFYKLSVYILSLIFFFKFWAAVCILGIFFPSVAFACWFVHDLFYHIHFLLLKNVFFLKVARLFSALLKNFSLQIINTLKKNYQYFSKFSSNTLLSHYYLFCI